MKQSEIESQILKFWISEKLRVAAVATRYQMLENMLASGCSVTDIKNHLGHEDVQSSKVYLQMNLPRRRKI